MIPSNKILLLFLFSLFQLAICNSVRAELANDSVDHICRYLEFNGLRTGTYRLQFEETQEYGTASDYKDLGEEPLPNNLAFYVTGSAKEVSELKLVLNVNVERKAAEAQKDLAHVASILVKRATGRVMSKYVQTDIEKGKEGLWHIGNYDVSLAKDIWPSGKGYSLNFAIVKSTKESKVREWADVSGKFTVTAEFAGLTNGEVSLRKTDGTVVKIELTKLSTEDQQWISDLQK